MIFSRGRSIKILVLGGTSFLGRHFVQEAQQRGHELTLFHRGKTGAELFPDLERIVGDRDKNIDLLAGRMFDAVLDTSGYFPDNVQEVSSKLEVGLYVFVSSCSVYNHYDSSVDTFSEQGPLVNLDIDRTDKGPETYGARKYLCEEHVRKETDNHLIVRPGLIVGPHDPTYRFPYWADRISEGGNILCPGDPEAPLQFIDARDLSEWILLGIEKGTCGTYNTVSPHGVLSLGRFLHCVREVINPESQLTWVEEDFLKERKVACWSELPLWVHREIQRFLKVDSNVAISMGLKFRPIEKTIQETHKWSRDIYRSQFLHKVLSRQREQELLGDWNLD